MSKVKHGENCNCIDCINKRKEKGDYGIKCSCGHCHDENECGVCVHTKTSFINQYGLSICKIVISALILIFSLLSVFNITVKLILSLIALLISGYEMVINCVKKVVKGDIFDENTLMIIASLFAMIIGEYFEGVLIVILFSIGELLEDIAVNNSRKRIAGLSKLKVEKVRLLNRSGLEEVSPKDVDVGSLIEIRSGDRIAIDGILVGVNAQLDMKAITGESKIVDVKNGDKVFSGAINVGNPIVIRTTKLYKDSTVEQIISLVEGANAEKAKSQKFITNFAKVYTPIAVVLSLIISVIPPLFNGEWTVWIQKGLSFLVISCPCALVISVPLGFFIGIGSLSKSGILVKGSCYIDILQKVEKVVLDKTGTITSGNFTVTDVIQYNGNNIEEILSYAYALESSSSHPIANAVANYTKPYNKHTAENITEIAGLGVKGYIEGQEVIIGKPINDFFDDENDINTCVYVTINNILSAKIVLTDTVKEKSKIAIKQLRNLGIETYMLSGDNDKVCKDIAEKVGINKDCLFSKLLPNEKYEKLKTIIRQTKGKVLYAGDGINDAPSIALADCGVSMGGLGSEIAIDSSNVVIMDDDISKIPLAIISSRKIKRKVIENIVGSIFIKVLVMVLSVVLPLPIWLAMFADVGVMLLAVLNSLSNYRLIREK